MTENVTLPNDENKIRDIILYNYLKRESYKRMLGLSDYLFDRELTENAGRIDIRIMPINPFINDEAYYIIECKRLDTNNPIGTTGLNGEYISEGICRFTSSKYSCYYKTNGMVGFVVQPMNIQENITFLNAIISMSHFPSNTQQNIQQRKLVDDFDYFYWSTHNIGDDEIIIYHLMLDFSNNIEGKRKSGLNAVHKKGDS
ncbi:MAG: hypothetical protein AAGU19_22570 [Prolixibacteraceae bacterium]